MPTVTGPKPRKFRNKPTTIDGITFDSKKESRRWIDLRAMERAGLISGLRRQVTFALRVNGVLICRYRSDFVYVENERRIVEDVKGLKTDIYKLKARLMLAVHGIEVREV